MQVDVRVFLKSGIADAEAETVERSLNMLGVDVKEVRVSKVYSLFVDAGNDEDAMKVANEACEKLLANPVINDFEIEVKHDQA
ncbi:MAG: phosphoribosylformylglycinamidine synthase subunit PurS [Candidatus Thermoplasmatota archaeon]|nr:phosphoribosylformylglycinamidine synthase subunit PurS [Candidatus Thermoplasmatota archaeon]